MILNSVAISNQLASYDELSDKDRLDILLSISKQINDEIKELSTDGNETYANLLKCKIVSKVSGVECSDHKKLNWSPQKYAEYEKLLKQIIKRVGTLGKIISKSQYEKALEVLNTL